EQRTTVARIDQVLHAKALGSTEWRGDGGERAAYPLDLGLRVGGLFQLRAERGLHAALNGKRAPVSRRPCPAAPDPLPADRSRAGNAVDPPEDHLRFGAPVLVLGGDRTCG